VAGTETRRGGSGWLSQSALHRFTQRVTEAIERARKIGVPTLASVSEQLSDGTEVVPLVLGARKHFADWAIIEQPDNQGSVVAGLGTAIAIEAEGPNRFAEVTQRWRSIVSGAIADRPDGPPGCGPLAIGGFAFRDRAAKAGPWKGFAAASLTVPEIAFARREGKCWLTAAAVVSGDDLVDEVAEALFAALARVEGQTPQRAEEESGVQSRIASALPPSHYESAVRRALESINRGEIEKVVLAREVIVERERDHDPESVLEVLREAFPSCFVFAVGRGDATFLGASPELLVRREGLRASTVALAGSAPRSADPAVDDHIGERLIRSSKDRGEQQIVTDRIEQILEPLSVWVTSAAEPVLAKIANVQHLATPIRAQLIEPVAAVDLAGRLHPTPAVGGEPWPEAESVMTDIEGLDRGWYAAPIGWTDASENGEFCVALRCALLRGHEARCYAGVGVVAKSDAEVELAETELKFQAILPAVAS